MGSTTEMSEGDFNQSFGVSKRVATDECKYDDKPIVASGVADCVCIFF